VSRLEVFVSPSAAERLARAAEVVRGIPAGARALVIGASRGPADDLARAVAASAPATFGIQRLSLTQLAARTAIAALAGEGRTPSTWLGAEAVAARAVFDASRDQALTYFEPVAATPGFPRALVRTLQELRLAGIRQADLERLPLAGPDLAGLLERFESAFDASATADRAALFDTAAQLWRAAPESEAAAHVVVLLDLPLEHAAEREFVAALVERSATSVATVPAGDDETLKAFSAWGGTIETHPTDGSDDLSRLRRFLFSKEPPPERALDGRLEFFSAPGEGRECVEIVRRILREARRGVRLDEMAILMRSPHTYAGLLEQALRRAEVAAFYDRGTRRPHPAGRAFLALLACAAEHLSASRFAEYLSLGQVPHADEAAQPAWEASQDEALGRPGALVPERPQEPAAHPGSESIASDPIVEGTLRAPRLWERLLVEAAVIGQDSSRWRRRLAGKAAELTRQIAEVSGGEGDEARVRSLEQTLAQLDQLRAFALPIVDMLAAWPVRARWGQWLTLFEALAPRVLRSPGYVLRVLADLRPMADVGPIGLDEARRVLADRLLTVEADPPSRRFGRVFVGTPQQARGRAFRVVFVPGLAERLFPQKPREDPLLLDALRADLDGGLPGQAHRLGAERLLLQLATGAASERLYVSYPRMELSESRARVPSFYALDVIRAATGRVPDHEVLEERARIAGNATLAWPAPADPEDAVDDQEHDLAVLRRLLDRKDRDAVKGHAHYLLKLNECLRRSVVARWARGEKRWSVHDGPIRVSAQTASALARQRLTARAYSLSALQRFSNCPYQFLLAAVYKLQPLEQPEPLQRLDPLTRGSLFHEIQAQFFRTLDAAGQLPVTTAGLAAARDTLNRVVDEAARRARDELAPAVERVWIDEVASIRRDLHAWLECVAADGDEWIPEYFEYAFGKVPGDRDRRSRAEEVALEGGFHLRGAIDLIEVHRQTGLLRITDHKTGRKPDRIEKVIVGGGTVLQPVLYAMAVERALDRPVSHGRLFYCTATGSFYSHAIPLNEITRAAGLEVLQVIDRSLEAGFLAAAPAPDACGRCDYRAVCGQDVERRVRRKPQDRLADLIALRERP
jgi:CRISPR/Cas system-associated exonuclease Cas4 (RecB family)